MEVNIGKSILAIDLEFARMFKKKYNKAAIMEVGMVLIEDFGLPSEKETRYSKMFNPGVKMNNYVRRVTGITRNMLKGLPRIENNLEEIQNIIDKADILLFHGGIQDIRALKLTGFDIKGKEIIDTLKIARNSPVHFDSHRLEDLTSEFDISNFDSHRALNDALMTILVYKELMLCENES